MLDQLIKSLQGFRVAGQPIGEGAILTINMMLGQIGMILGKRIAKQMNIPTMPAKLLGDGAAVVGLPMLVKGIRLGGDNATDRLSVALIAMSVNDILGTSQIVDNMLKAIPFLSGAGELGAENEYYEIPEQTQELFPAPEVETYEDYSQTPEPYSAETFAGVAEEDEILKVISATSY